MAYYSPYVLTLPTTDYSQPDSSYSQPIKVIQLEEVEAPPVPQRSSSSSASVPLTSAYSDSYDSEDDYDDDDTHSESESEEEESECSSYCSSDEEDMQERNNAVYDDTYGTRISRVLAWRDNFAKAVGVLPDDTELLSHTPHALKRKIDYDHEDVFDDSTSSSSKRSRSTSPEPSSSSSTSSSSYFENVPPAWPQRRLSAHSCPACDEGFNTKQSLQQHGLDPKLSDACRVAVLYNLETK
ncbi:hypothetical protein QCA50_007099 [Cerrena zonata]|uniref:C2H2-type domain-containing protein n=1 Tax=Cerrena zonata TaxID=2478898 RepID=A0AAW0G7D7_9APHY